MTKNTTQLGFTVVELLVAMAVFGVIIAATYSAFNVHNRMAAKQEETTAMQQELLSLMTQITGDLRMCGYSPTKAGGFGFAHSPGANAPDFRRQTTTTAIYCTLDGNSDGVVNQNSNGDHIAYAININSNGNPSNAPNDFQVIRKYTTGTVRWQPAATNISALNFTYFDRNGDTIPNPSVSLGEIRSVEVNATAVPSPERSRLNIPPRTMSTRVYCRNLGL